MSLCKWYNYQKISPWINSLNSTGFKGDKIIIGVDIDKELEKQIIKSDIYCYKTKSTTNEHIFMERHKHFIDFLKIFKNNYEYIIITDIKDIIFQKNPEEWIKSNIKNYDIISSSESIKIKNENWNKYEIYNALGNTIGQSMENHEAFCAGILAGKTEEIFKILILLYENSIKAKNTSSADQPFFNYIIHSNILKQKILPANHDNGWSLNCGVAACDRTEKEFKKYLLHNPPYIDSNNIIRNFKNEEICIIHQYDRNSLWKDILLKKYS